MVCRNRDILNQLERIRYEIECQNVLLKKILHAFSGETLPHANTQALTDALGELEDLASGVPQQQEEKDES